MPGHRRRRGASAYLAAKGVPATRFGRRPGASGSRSRASRSSRSNAITGRRSGCRTARSPPACRWRSSSMPTTMSASITMATRRSSSDMKLQAELTGRPSAASASPIRRRSCTAIPMPGEMLTGEMSPYEGLLAAQWLGLETVLPCHYLKADDDVTSRAFMRYHAEAKARGEAIAGALCSIPGDWIEFDASGRRAHAEGWRERRCGPGAFFEPPFDLKLQSTPSPCAELADRVPARSRCRSRRRPLRGRSLHLSGKEPLRDLSARRRARDRRRGQRGSAQA